MSMAETKKQSTNKSKIWKKSYEKTHENIGCPQCLFDLNDNSYIFMEFFLCFPFSLWFSKYN